MDPPDAPPSDAPTPDLQGLSEPETQVRVEDSDGRPVGELAEGFVFSGMVQRCSIRVTPALRTELGVPDVVDVEASWLRRVGEHLARLDRPIGEALSEMGFNV